MNNADPSFSKENIFKQLSIERRLPLFIFLLLLLVVAAFGSISYFTVKKASTAIGAERVTTLADTLSQMFKTSFDTFLAQVNTVAVDSNVKAFLKERDEKHRAVSANILQSILTKDNTSRQIQLFDANKNVLLSSGALPGKLGVDIDSLRSRQSGKPGYFNTGKIILLKGSMYYPLVVEVKDGGVTRGYVIDWKILYATRQSVNQLAQLLGASGTLYFGNDDQQFWTDMVKPVARPPIAPDALTGATEYSRGNLSVIAAMRRIPHSRWLVLVELSGASFQETAGLFLPWLVLIGVLLIIAGSLGGWLMSRNITRPLKQLSHAAAAIAEGNYATHVDVERQDELGTLGASFNIMAERVQASQQDLKRTVQDRTRQLETAITDIEDQKESDRKKDEFISIASHELKTPLTTLKAFIQLADKEISPEFKSYKFIGNASRQLNRMERLIADLLDVSRINSGKMQYNFENFDLDTLLKATIESAQHISAGHKLVLESSVPAVVYADRHRIEQVIVNLLSNAVKYSPEADKVLICSELGGGKIRVVIKDFGIGISKKDMEALFDRYYRVQGSEYRFQGLGLGLFISSEIIKRHNGRIWVKSEPGSGSEFTFELPVV